MPELIQRDTDPILSLPFSSVLLTFRQCLIYCLIYITVLVLSFFWPPLLRKLLLVFFVFIHHFIHLTLYSNYSLTLPVDLLDSLRPSFLSSLSVLASLVSSSAYPHLSLDIIRIVDLGSHFSLSLSSSSSSLAWHWSHSTSSSFSFWQPRAPLLVCGCELCP